MVKVSKYLSDHYVEGVFNNLDNLFTLIDKMKKSLIEVKKAVNNGGLVRDHKVILKKTIEIENEIKKILDSTESTMNWASNTWLSREM